MLSVGATVAVIGYDEAQGGYYVEGEAVVMSETETQDNYLVRLNGVPVYRVIDLRAQACPEAWAALLNKRRGDAIRNLQGD